MKKFLWRRFQDFRASQSGSAVELALILPLLLIMLTGILDAANLLADRRAAQRLAESIVRAAHTFDRAVISDQTLPLSQDQITILRNIAGRMMVQLPAEENYIWLGRYVRPQPNEQGQQNVRQLLPLGLTRADNQGLLLAGSAGLSGRINGDFLTRLEAIAEAGEVIYAVEIGFTRAFLTPLPPALARQLFTVRYMQ